MLLTQPKRVYFGAVIGQVTTVGLATTYTGLCLSNPNNSNVNLFVNHVGIAFLVAFPAAAAVGLLSGYSGTDVTHTTPITPTNQTGSGTAVGKLDSAATLPGTPLLNTIIGAGLTGAITTGPIAEVLSYSPEQGEYVINPGGYLAIYTSAVSGTAAGAFSFRWSEAPLSGN